MNGDPSQWDTAMKMPHYAALSMPAASLLEAHHVLQWLRNRRFAMYDYGDVHLNRQAYKQERPPDIAAEYHRLDVPVDIAAGSRDMIIERAAVFLHVQHMQAAGLEHVTYREFDFGHLDFTMKAKLELRRYVLSKLEPWRRGSLAAPAQ